MSIPRNLCFFPLDNVRLTKCLEIVSMNFVLNSSSMCDTLLLSAYHYIVHCLTLIVIFSMHLLYRLAMNQCNFRVFEYRSYHNSSYSIHPYRAFISCKYSNFTPFSKRTVFLCLDLFQPQMGQFT